MSNARWQHMCIFRNAAIYGFDHHATVIGIEVRLKTRLQTIQASMFVTEHIIKRSLFCDVASRLAEAIVLEMFVQTFVVLQMAAFIGSGFLAWHKSH